MVNPVADERRRRGSPGRLALHLLLERPQSADDAHRVEVEVLMQRLLRGLLPRLFEHRHHHAGADVEIRMMGLQLLEGRQVAVEAAAVIVDPLPQGATVVAADRLLVQRLRARAADVGDQPAAPVVVRLDPLLEIEVVGDEAVNNNGIGGLKYIWVYDIREPGNPVSIATMPQPAEADYCAKGGKFGSHNLHENRPGAFQSSRLIFATYYNAGVRVFDITNPFRPEEAGYFVPPAPQKMMDPRPGMPQVIQNADCYVDKEGFIYLTDPNAGLYILKYEGPLI